jgi:opacity protein-like surface antigen
MNLSGKRAFLGIRQMGGGRLGLIGAVLSLLMAATGFAQQPKEGFFAGAGASAAFSRFELVVENTVSRMSIDTSQARTAMLGGVSAGYGHTTPKGLYLGAEVGMGFPKNTATIRRYGVLYTGDVFVNHLSVRDALTVDGLLGFRPSGRLLAYARAGISIAGVSLSQVFTPSIARSSFSSQGTRPAARMGVGAAYSLGRRFAVGCDLVYTRYDDFGYDWTEFNVTLTQKVGTTGIAGTIIVHL